MAFRSETKQEEGGFVEAVREKYRLVLVLAVLAVINLASQHFRHRGLNGKEMLIGTLALAVAAVLYAYMRALWDVKVRRGPLRAKECRQDQS